jgi:cytochrome c-type biogenesis protein
MLQILIAILAGVLTVAAPCILPLLPILLGTAVGQTSRSRPLFIVAGFILVFSLASLFISLVARHLGISPNSIRTLAIIVLGLFGLLMIWPQPFELATRRLSAWFGSMGRVGTSAGTGNIGGLVLGMTLGIVWTPCAGPVLGSVLTLVAAQQNFLTAGILLVAYALGAAVPMLLIAYGGQYATAKVRSIAKYAGFLQRAFGIVIVLLALAIYFNYDTQIYALILQHYPAFSPKY